MKTEWKNFLVNHGAEINDGVVEHFGNPERELRVINTGDILVDLSNCGLISIRGEDTVNFLQGQFTNDMRLISSTQSQLSSYCTPKGRILSIFLVF